MEWKIREAYVQDLLAQHYFKELHKRQKVKGTTLKKKALRWKQSRIYGDLGTAQEWEFWESGGHS
jgi:hypothetical protein